jgi:hypothetical protein
MVAGVPILPDLYLTNRYRYIDSLSFVASLALVVVVAGTTCSDNNNEQQQQAIHYLR